MAPVASAAAAFDGVEDGGEAVVYNIMIVPSERARLGIDLLQTDRRTSVLLSTDAPDVFHLPPIYRPTN
jgi:hypothetical protein